VLDIREVNNPYNGLYGEAPPERGTFFRLQEFEKIEVALVEIRYRRRWGKLSFWLVKRLKGLTDAFYG